MNRGLIGCLLLTSCHSVEWRPGPGQDWRHLHCYSGPLASVAARDEAAASDAYLDLQRLCEAMQRAGIPAPGRPLALATSIEDPLLFAEALPTVQKLASLHAQAVGTGQGTVHGDVQPPEIPGLFELMAHVCAAAVPLDTADFDLPDSWRQDADWMVVLPTNACSDAAASELLDLGLAQRNLSFGEKLLLAPLMPFVRSKARSELRHQVLGLVLEAAIAAARRRGTVSDEAVEQVRQELGLGSP